MNLDLKENAEIILVGPGDDLTLYFVLIPGRKAGQYLELQESVEWFQGTLKDLVIKYKRPQYEGLKIKAVRVNSYTMYDLGE